MENSMFQPNHYHSLLYINLQNSFIYNGILADHYRELFFNCSRGWRFTKAAFCFLKWQAYERKAATVARQLKINL